MLLKEKKLGRKLIYFRNRLNRLFDCPLRRGARVHEACLLIILLTQALMAYTCVLYDVLQKQIDQYIVSYYIYRDTES